MDKDLGFTHRFIPAHKPDLKLTLLLLHGTGGNETDLIPLGQALAPGAALLSPRGKISENGMPRFFRRLAEGVFDVEDLKQRTHELADFVEASATHYQFNKSRVVAVGYSNGANIAASALLLRPGVLRGAVLFHPMVPFVPDPLPNLQAVPVFMGAGQFDPIVPVDQTEQLAALFQQCGADVALHWQPGGHSLGQEEVAAAQQWLADYFIESAHAV